MINAILSLFGGPVAAPPEPIPARPFKGVLAGLIPGWTGEAEGERRPAGTGEAAAAAGHAPELVGLGIRLRGDWARPAEAAPGAGNGADAPADGASGDAAPAGAGTAPVAGSQPGGTDGDGAATNQSPAALAPTAADDGTEPSRDPASDESSDAGVPTAAGGPGALMRSKTAGTSERRTDAESATPPAAAGSDGSLAPDSGEGTAAASDRRADIRVPAAPGSSADRPEDTDARDGRTNGSAAAAVAAPALPGRTDTPSGQGATDRPTDQGRGQGATMAPEQSPARPGAGKQRAEGSADVAGTGAPAAHGGPQRPARPAGAAALGQPWGPGRGKASGNSPATGDGARSNSARAATGHERAPVGAAENREAEPAPHPSAAESATAGGAEADGVTRTADQARARADIAASARAFARRRTAGKDGGTEEADSRRVGSVARGVAGRPAGSDEAEAGPSSDRRPLTVDGAARRGPAGIEAGPFRSVDPVRGPDAAARVETIDALREQEARQPLHRVSVRVGEGESATRVRVNLRGDAVQSEMATESKPLASRLGRELPELNRALQSQGLETDGLRVRHGDRVVAADPGPTRTAASPRSGGDSQEQMSQRSGSQHEPHDGRRRHREHSNEEGNE